MSALWEARTPNEKMARALEDAGREDIAWEPWTRCLTCGQDDIRKPDICPRCGGACYQPARSFTHDLNATVDALNALGLRWQKTGVKTVAVWRYGEQAEIQPADDATPAALATAFVQAALRVLGEEETGDLG